MKKMLLLLTAILLLLLCSCYGSVPADSSNDPTTNAATGVNNDLNTPQLVIPSDASESEVPESSEQQAVVTEPPTEADATEPDNDYNDGIELPLIPG